MVIVHIAIANGLGTPPAWLMNMPNEQYQLGELLGRGGMGQVHIARHRSGRLVAVKRVRDTLSLDPVVVDRLTDEARLLRSVSHPNVVRALDDGTGSDGKPFLVMDRAHGTPLNQLIAQHGVMPRERLRAIASQLFAGLAAIHDAQIVHADLKSHNVLVDEVDIVTIIDFGLARAVSATPDDNDLVAGTPAYMAPEMIAGAQPTVAADIYAMSTILYEMMTGSTPFTGHISTILTRQLSEAVEPPSQRAAGRGITSALDRVIMRGLAPSPAARYATVRELSAAFDAALEDSEDDPTLARGSVVHIPRPTVLHRPRRQPAIVNPAPARRAAPQLPASSDTATDHTARLVRAPDESPVPRTESTIALALDRARALIDQHRPALAIDQLETTLAELAPAIDSDEPISASVWRLQTVLAALYESLGLWDHARRMARVAFLHALRTGCPIAEGRTRGLVDRLVVRPRRLARGSAGGDTATTTTSDVARTARIRRPSASDGNR